VKKLLNGKEVFERARKVFDPSRVPMIDMEPLQLYSQEFGLIEFEKMAVQIIDADARLDAWSVFLNICSADNIELLWQRIGERLDRELNWSKYAISYDRLLLHFDDYLDLVQGIVNRVHGCKRCLDLGAGTGNGSLALLRDQPGREVWAVEVNHSMIERLIDKIVDAQEEDDCDYFSRLTPVKEDVCRLYDLPNNSFDAAILINVLYAVDDPAACLRQVYELLAPGGRLVLSTAHVDTDVNKLFARMKSVLTNKQVFGGLQSFFVDALARHQQMDKLIHRDTKQDIRRWLMDADFEIVDWQDSAYVDAVVVVEARKPA
jgi:ubiquinone/menaquinone biosynthesis C-methylase UbiE